MILCLGTTPALQRIMIFAGLSLDAVNRALEVRQWASGKVTNVARVVHTLGEEVLATGFLGGNHGTLIAADLDAAGIAHAFVQVPQNTRMCVTLVDSNAHAATELVEEPQAVAGEFWQALLDELAAHLGRASVLVLSGSLAPGGPPDFYARCAQLAHAAGAAVIVDARGAALRGTLPLRPLLIKPNREELADAVHMPVVSEEELRGAMGEATRRGAQWILVTLGKDGSILTDGRRFWRISAPEVVVASSIGCGDAYAAGVAVAIKRGQSLPDACRLGAACAAANAQTPLAGEIDLQEAQRLLPQVHVQLL